ncbi:MAG TPA: O-antigen ligase family protein [Lacipirellulaceae bacterium]|nr:O-antigen ligase family protein [Lacipirellulaceae bacterium]
MGANLADLKRKDADASAEHSVYQRASFVYVSMRMFRDAPVLGCGLGRFYDCKIPYLADRSQHLELESLRSLDHHNTLLSVLVETGLVGFVLFVGLLAAWTVAAWRLAFDVARPAWQRRQGLFALATMLTYLSSAVFHGLTPSPTEHWLLFFAAGAALAVRAAPRGARKTCLAEPRRMSIPTATPALVPGV